MTPVTVRRIDPLVFRVLDLHRDMAFYQSVLGGDVVRHRVDLGRVHLRAGLH